MKYILYPIIVLCYAFLMGSILLFHGPFPAVRQYVIDSLETTMHGYLLEPLALYTLSPKLIKSAQPKLTGFQKVSTQVQKVNYSQVQSTAIHVTTYHGQTYTAYIMSIRDPNRIKVGVTPYLGKYGMTISQMVAKDHAIGGINGGAFMDSQNWRGTGGLPQGITIVDGKVITANQQSSNQTVVGITNLGQLICGPYNLTHL